MSLHINVSPDFSLSSPGLWASIRGMFLRTYSTILMHERCWNWEDANEQWSDLWSIKDRSWWKIPPSPFFHTDNCETHILLRSCSIPAELNPGCPWQCTSSIMHLWIGFPPSLFHSYRSLNHVTWKHPKINYLLKTPLFRLFSREVLILEMPWLIQWYSIYAYM